MLPLDLLNFVSTGAAFLDSTISITRICQLLSSSAQSYEETYGITPELSDILEQLSPEDYIYLVRSPRARSLLNEINREITGQNFSDTTTYSKLLTTVRSLLDKNNFRNCEILGSRITLGTYPYLFESWSSVQSSDLLHDAMFVDSVFKSHLSPLVSVEECELTSPSDEILRTLQSIFSDFARISSLIVRDIVVNMHFFCFFVYKSGSASISGAIAKSFTAGDLPMTSFFSPLSFSSYETAFEGIYHEALHSKFVNMYTSHSTFNHNHEVLAKERFSCPWISTNIGAIFRSQHLQIDLSHSL